MDPLKDLLTMRGLREFTRFQAKSHVKHYLQNLFERGLRSSERSSKRDNVYQLWSDAEEFLDFVDTAAQPQSNLAEILMKAVSEYGPANLAGAAQAADYGGFKTAATIRKLKL